MKPAKYNRVLSKNHLGRGVIRIMIKKYALPRAMIYVKKHYAEDSIVIAMCDEEILGRKLVDEEKGIVFHVDPAFYKGDLIPLEEAVDMLARADIANLVGEKIVRAAVENGYVHGDAVVVIDGVPHAQFVVMEEGVD